MGSCSMGSWRRYLRLKAEAKTGLSSDLLIWAALAIVFGMVAFGFVLLAAFIWLAELYRPLVAALTLCAFFLLITIIALSYCLHLRRETVKRAELLLAAPTSAPWVDPRLAGMTLQVGRSLGWRRMAPLLAVAVLAVGVGMRWIGRSKSESENGEPERRRELARAA
jgi:hypothetical protein